MTGRLWYRVDPDRKIHGLTELTDEQALERLERGEKWAPAIGGAKLIAELGRPCDGSGVVIPGFGLCPLCEGLGC